jgi:hypothetical protein
VYMNQGMQGRNQWVSLWFMVFCFLFPKIEDLLLVTMSQHGEHCYNY